MRDEWQLQKLSKATTTIMGQAPAGKDCNKNGDGTPFVKVGEFGFMQPEIREWTTDPKKFACKTDVLLCVVGATCGKINLGEDCAIGRSVAAIRPEEKKLDQFFLYYFLQGRVEQMRNSSQGAAQTVISKTMIADIDIPLPPLPEQKRIVAILDEAFAGISQAVANAEKNLANARELFESYLNGVFERKGDGWVEKSFGNICDFVRGPFGGSLKKSCFVDKGYAVYEQQHAINNQFDHIRYFIDEKKFIEMSRFELCSGDLIMSCSGTMGRVAITPDDVKQGIINQALLKLSPKKDLVAEFLKYWMESLSFQEQIALHSQGAAIKNVASVKVLKMIDVPVPAIEVQKNIVSKLDMFNEQAEHLETIYQQKLTALTELKQSILQKAFAGELTRGKRYEG